MQGHTTNTRQPNKKQEHKHKVQNSTLETWSHPNTMRASGARALACSATHELPTRLSYAPRTLEQKSNSVGTKKGCAGSAGAKKSVLDTQVTHWHTASRRCQPALLQTDRGWRQMDRQQIDRQAMGVWESTILLWAIFIDTSKSITCKRPFNDYPKCYLFQMA